MTSYVKRSRFSKDSQFMTPLKTSLHLNENFVAFSFSGQLYAGVLLIVDWI